VRTSFEFVGTISKAFDLDPAEFRGCTQADIMVELLTLLDSAAPGVDFILEDVYHAAWALHEPL
jgi:hypothetical protein